MMGNEYYNPQFNTNMYGQAYGQPMQDRLMQMRQQYQAPMQHNFGLTGEYAKEAK